MKLTQHTPSPPFLNPHFPLHQFSPNKKLELIQEYHRLNIHDYHQLLLKRDEQEWQDQGRKKALHLFHLAAKHVPAYKDFLKKNKIKPEKVKSFTDFQKIPPTDKPSYMNKYSLEELSWHGKLENSNIISFSSGSLNKPYLWPRSIYQDYEGAFAFEHLLTYLFKIHEKSTLFVNCFSMGNYVAGVYVYTSIKLLSHKGYPITIVSPGINYEDIYNVLTPVKHKYEQIILAGYPPFIREVIDLGLEKGVNFNELDLKFFFASEFFSEDWRDQTLKKTGSREPLVDSTNIYGTADSAIFSYETPTAILIRKLIAHNHKAHQDLFNSSLTPTLTQYNPLLTFYESVDNELTLTSGSGLPLIRYNLKDRGGIINNEQIDRILESHSINLKQELIKHDLQSTRINLPFVYLTNRTDGAVSFYGIKIFPEYIRHGIQHSSLVNYLTGKFTLESKHDQQNNPLLLVHVELNQNIEANKKIQAKVTKQVAQSLRQQCSEFSFLESSIGAKAQPRIKLHSFQEPNYFSTDIKQKWISE